eukprot:3527554-Pyramimonas_sp.AAC.1
MGPRSCSVRAFVCACMGARAGPEEARGNARRTYAGARARAREQKHRRKPLASRPAANKTICSMPSASNST